MKKISFITSLLSVVVCGISAQAQADVCCPPPPPCPAPCYVNPCDSLCDGTFTVGADYLYWKAEQENLAVGEVVEVDGTSTTTHTLNPHFNYKSGFKVRGGYDLPGNEWGVSAEYTHFKANAHVSANIANPNETTSYIATDPILANQGILGLGTLSSSWDLHFNQVDVDFSRKIAFGESFTLRPHMGFRTIWWHQTQTLSGVGEDLSATTPVIVDVDGRVKEKLDGYGLEGGLWADWNVGYGFSLVGHVGGSVLYSTYKIRVSGSANADASGTLLGTLNSSNTVHTGTPTFDYFAGLQYSDCLFDTLVAARLGWEQHVILNANQFAGSHGNLSAAGLTAGLDVRF